MQVINGRPVPAAAPILCATGPAVAGTSRDRYYGPSLDQEIAMHRGQQRLASHA
jgi:hypothetical protein